MTGVATTTLPLSVLRRGKVRDVYEVDADRLLVVATDRVSAFDVVMRETVPYKGAVLTQLTAWWLRQLASQVPHHMISADADEIIREVPALEPHRDLLRGRAMLAWRAEVFPVECVIRGYIAGSAWKEYRTHGTLAGEALPAGLRESDRLEPPIIRWKLRVLTAPANSPTYEVDFPIRVHGTSAEGFWDEINSDSVPDGCRSACS